jgi:hypothetical protein
MSCPNWFELVERREQEPEAWELALEHHDDCERCREQALEAEPTLLFRMPLPVLDRSEIDAMKQAVTTMRRTSSLTRPAVEKPAARAAFRARRYLEAAAVGGLLLGAAFFQQTLSSEGPAPAAIVAHPGDTAPAGSTLPVATSLLATSDAPLVEELDPKYGSVIEVVDQDLSIVLVVPELDV